MRIKSQKKHFLTDRTSSLHWHGSRHGQVSVIADVRHKIMIRSISESDREAIACIQAESFPEQSCEEIESLAFHWRTFPEFCIVGCRNDTPCGYLLAHPWPLKTAPPINALGYEVPFRADSMFIHDLALSRAARGSGLASEMVNHVIMKSRDAGFRAMCLISVQDTKGFWSRFGFEQVPEVPPDYFDNLIRIYPDGEFVYMEKSL